MSETPTPTIPSANQIKARLRPLSTAQVEALAKLSGVPFHTLLKIKAGAPKGTANPGIDTVRKFFQHIDAAKAAA